LKDETTDQLGSDSPKLSEKRRRERERVLDRGDRIIYQVKWKIGNHKMGKKKY
jgi:hypothetical protein